MKDVLAALVPNLKTYTGAKTVLLADPRSEIVGVELTDLPGIVLTVLSSAAYAVIPGHPHEITTVDNPKYPDEEPYPYNAQVTYRYEDFVTVQCDVYGDADADLTSEQSALSVAEKAVAWLMGIGCYELRKVKARVANITAPRRMVELPAELESLALDRWTFEVTLVVPRVASTEVETVESVVMGGQFEGAVHPDRQIEVNSQ